MDLLWVDSSVPTSTLDSWIMRDGRKYVLHSWIDKCHRTFHRHYEAAISSLTRLHIITNPSSKLGLNSTLKAAFRMAITGEYVHTSNFPNGLTKIVFTTSGEHRSFGVPAEQGEKRSGTVEVLDAYAVERWEVHIFWSRPTMDLLIYFLFLQTILHFMVSSGTGQAPAKPSQGVLYLLQRSGLMATMLSQSYVILNTFDAICGITLILTGEQA